MVKIPYILSDMKIYVLIQQRN